MTRINYCQIMDNLVVCIEFNRRCINIILYRTLYKMQNVIHCQCCQVILFHVINSVLKRTFFCSIVCFIIKTFFDIK